MKFTDKVLSESMDAWLATPGISDVAAAQNFEIEERLPASRSAFFESFATLRAPSRTDLRNRLIDYYETYVRTSSGAVPHSFRALYAALSASVLSPDIGLVRLERLDEELDYAPAPMTFENLSKAVAAGDVAYKDAFVAQINASSVPKNPCSFAAMRDEVWAVAENRDDGWENRLRDRLGLSHFNPPEPGKPIRVALFEYSVQDVLDCWSAKIAPGPVFCVPTVLDVKPSAAFFPTPRELSFGCPMALFPIYSDENLIAELLHPRLDYAGRHLTRVGLITEPAARSDLKELRNNHLSALRLAALRDDFGMEVV